MMPIPIDIADKQPHCEYVLNDYKQKNSTRAFRIEKIEDPRKTTSLKITKSHFEEIANTIITEFVSSFEEWSYEYIKTLESFDQQLTRNGNLTDKERKSLLTILGTLRNSNRATILFKDNLVDKILPLCYVDFVPGISFDENGDISLEWYGRKDVRALMTICGNGMAYFVSIFHGETLKFIFFLPHGISTPVSHELERIYKDKQP